MPRIDLLLDGFGRAFQAAGDIVPWPIHVGKIFPFFSDLEAADIYSKLQAVSKMERPHEIIKKMLIGPSVSKATLLTDLIVGLKVTNPPTSAADRVWFVEYVLDVLEGYQPGDIFCRDGRNLIHTDDEIQIIIDNTPWLSLASGNGVARSIYRCSASAQALIWSLFFYGWTDVGFEIHGPYDVISKDGRKHKLLIRDFFDPKPALLWKSVEGFPYSSFKIMALHDSRSDFHVDLFNHLTHKVSLLDSTIGIHIEVNGQPIVTETKIEQIGKDIRDQIGRQHDIISQMSKEEIVSKFIESRYYAMRKWRLLFDEDWRPPAEIRQRIRKTDWGQEAKLDPLTWHDLRRGFDPRDEFIL